MNELWYDDLSLKSEDIKILPIKFEYLIGRHFKNEVSIFLPDFERKWTYENKKSRIKRSFQKQKKQQTFIQPIKKKG